MSLHWTLHQDDQELAVAVKVLNLQKQKGRSFIAECKALREIRHRNLCKVLIYEFMPRGSLESWLHTSNAVTGEPVRDNGSRSLSVLQRINNAIDVGSALEYLHTGCGDPIIYCDLKPSNVLLDDEITAHVAGFGLTRFLTSASAFSTANQTSSSQVRGMVGYAAPEYGLGSKVSPAGDVYSFGVIVFTGLNLREYSNSAQPNQILEIIDQGMIGDANLLHPRTIGDIRKVECIKLLIMVGVQCYKALPQERMSLSNALNELKSARQNILTGGPRNHTTMLD